MWKARASDKLGVIDARERAAMEYRDSLKERWKFDPEIGRVMRYIVSPGFMCGTHSFTGRGTYPSRSTRRAISRTPCWRRNVSKKSAGASTHARARTNQKRSARKWLLPSKPRGLPKVQTSVNLGNIHSRRNLGSVVPFRERSSLYTQLFSHNDLSSYNILTACKQSRFRYFISPPLTHHSVHASQTYAGLRTRVTSF